MRLALPCLAVFVVASLVPSIAAAQPSPPPPNSVSWRQQRAPDVTLADLMTRGLEGFELEIRGGVMIPDTGSPVLAPNIYGSLGATQNANNTGDILRGIEKPYGVSLLSLSITAGYRFLPWLSAGVFFDIANYSALDGTDTGDYSDGTSQLQRVSWQLGAYGRFYLTTLHPRLHPWAELGVGYSQDTASYERDDTQGSTQPTPIDYYVSDQGIAVNGRLGLDVRLSSWFSIGPVVGYERVFLFQGCVQTSPVSDPDNIAEIPPVNSCSAPTVQTSGWGQTFLGLYLKATLFGPTVR
jgi:hypothetical protein